MRKITKIALLGLTVISALLLVSCSTVERTNRNHWEGPTAEIEAVLNQSLAAYQRGDISAAEQLAKDAYFDVFESRGLETAIRLNIGSQRAFTVEYGFTEINQAIRAGADEAEGSAGAGAA